MKAVRKFAQSLNSEFSVKGENVVEDEGRYYLVGNQLFPFVKKGIFLAGTYLGKIRKGKFFPSFNLLAKLAESGGRSVSLDKKAAWLFICGRDVFFPGIKSVRGSVKKGDYVLVLNEFGDCLGFGRAVVSLQIGETVKQVAVRNVSDVGDFLRREH